MLFKKKKKGKEETATLSILPPGGNLRLFLGRCWPHPPLTQWTHTALLFAMFMFLNVNPQFIMQSVFKEASQKEANALGAKVTRWCFMKGTHYQNKRAHNWCNQTSRMSPDTAQQVIWAVFLNGVMSIDERERITLLLRELSFFSDS